MLGNIIRTIYGLTSYKRSRGNPVAAFQLGLVQVVVGRTEQFLATHPGAQQRDTHTDADRQARGDPAQVDGTDRGPDPFRDDDRLAEVRAYEDGELVARVPDREVVGPAVVLQGTRDGPQYLVADRVRVPVVDGLEPVQVQQQEYGRVRHGTRVDARDQLVEVATVTEAGERVAQQCPLR